MRVTPDEPDSGEELYVPFPGHKDRIADRFRRMIKRLGWRLARFELHAGV
jgi:hypothetical protein